MEVLFVQEISGVYTSLILDTDELKMALQGKKVSWTFEKQVPGRILKQFRRQFKHLIRITSINQIQSA